MPHRWGLCSRQSGGVAEHGIFECGGVPLSTSLLRSGENNKRSFRPQQVVEMESSGKLQNEPLAANRARWTSYRRHSSMSEATRPVQPVWCDAPRPAPLSPW